MTNVSDRSAVVVDVYMANVSDRSGVFVGVAVATVADRSADFVGDCTANVSDRSKIIYDVLWPRNLLFLVCDSMVNAFDRSVVHDQCVWQVNRV